MIDVLKEKIKSDNIKNFNPIKINLLENKMPFNNLDVIYTLMTLHHIVDLDKVLQIFNKALKTNGFLCIADLVKEDGSFHADKQSFEGHNGFDKEELSAVLLKNGFKTAYYKICAEAEKESNDAIKKYPLFLIVAKKMIS